MRKLYKATTTITVFFESTEDDADFDGEDALQEEVRGNGLINSDVLIEEVTDPKVERDGWDSNALIYGTEKDTTLAEALERVRLQQKDPRQLDILDTIERTNK